MLEKYAASGEFSRPEALSSVEETELDHTGNPLPRRSPSITAFAPAPATPPVAPVMTARADQDGFFKKWFGMGETEPVGQTPLTAPPTLASPTVPLPPRRG